MHRSAGKFRAGEDSGKPTIEAIYHYGAVLTAVPVLLTAGLIIITLASIGRIEETNRRGGISESGRQYLYRLRRRGMYLWAISFVSWGAFSYFLAGVAGVIG